MTDLFMLSLPLDMQPFHHWAAQRGLGRDEGVALHHLLSEAFGKGALQPFRLMVGRGASHGTIYAYASSDAAALKAVANETAAPELLAASRPERLLSKSLPNAWREGKRLAFDIRLRPVRRLLRPLGDFAKGAEVDAFLIESMRQSPQGSTPGTKLQREEVYGDWLRERLDGAAELAKSDLVGFRRHIALRNGTHREGPDAILHGELIVTNGPRLAHLLARGVGRHTAYGYGMLLLRPASKDPE